jgi:hypothetical protein
MIEYDFEQGNEINDGMTFGSAIELPFIAPPVWVVNGDPRLRAMATVAPALFFGGWSANLEDVKSAGEEYRVDHYPTGFVEAEMTSRDNKPLKNVVSRVVIVAPFGVRKSWITKDKTRYTQYVAGSRQHIQVLAMLASKEEGKYLPFYPILLSAKGWQASHLEKALSTWQSKTASVRSKIAKASSAPDIPANMFWSAIGTWGQEPKVENVGAGNEKSPITPVSAFIPKEITEEGLEGLFVGKAVIEDMLDLKRQAKDWLSAWSHLTANGTPVAGPAAIPPTDDQFLVPQDVGSNGEDIPF